LTFLVFFHFPPSSLFFARQKREKGSGYFSLSLTSFSVPEIGRAQCARARQQPAMLPPLPYWFTLNRKNEPPHINEEKEVEVLFSFGVDNHVGNTREMEITHVQEK
jgi:hypothetical protein